MSTNTAFIWRIGWQALRGAAGTIEEQFAVARVAGEGRGVFEIGLAFAAELG
ncbi:MAG: hypothetical protein WB607_10190 [Candidatus Acidiferrum sp.]|jgi:hypothetical protein